MQRLTRFTRPWAFQQRSFATLTQVIKPSIDVQYKQLFINGKYVNSLSGTELNVIDPRNEEIICSVSAAQEEDIDLAVNSAKKTFESGIWSTRSAYYREQVLNKWADLIEEKSDYLMQLETWNNGKPLTYSKLDLHFCVECIRYFAGWANKIHGKIISCNDVLGAKHFAYTLHEPKGVIASITPWNFPLLMFVWQVAPALACGNTIVAKVAETTPLTALFNGQLLSQAGVPDGVVNIVPGLGTIAGRSLAQHPSVDKITFTGSGVTGKDIMISAAKNLTSITLELGGKSPAIIFPDCNLDNAIDGMQIGLFLNQGQCCCASSRIFVHESIYDEFVEKTIEKSSKRRIGDPFTEVDQGPQQNANQFNKVLKYIQSGKEQGANLLLGGNRYGDQGYFVQTTVFIDVTDDMDIAKDEIFGPVMQIMKFKSTEEVLERANNTHYGLAAAIYSQNIDTINYMTRSLKAGTVFVNCYDVFDASLPFGGYKQSGFGRSKSEYALDNFVNVKCVTQALPNCGPFY